MISFIFTFSWVNPARAGMIRHCPSLSLRPLRKPRASGDDPWSLSGYPVVWW